MEVNCKIVSGAEKYCSSHQGWFSGCEQCECFSGFVIKTVFTARQTEARQMRTFNIGTGNQWDRRLRLDPPSYIFQILILSTEQEKANLSSIRLVLTTCFANFIPFRSPNYPIINLPVAQL